LTFSAEAIQQGKAGAEAGGKQDSIGHGLLVDGDSRERNKNYKWYQPPRQQQIM
jgi:hypothetical protein